MRIGSGQRHVMFDVDWGDNLTPGGEGASGKNGAGRKVQGGRTPTEAIGGNSWTWSYKSLGESLRLWEGGDAFRGGKEDGHNERFEEKGGCEEYTVINEGHTYSSTKSRDRLPSGE